MGESSIIARRLPDGHVQFGWSGEGGNFQHVGRKLLDWYNTPDMVAYLFSLGQMERLVNPLADGDQYRQRTTVPAGEPYFIGTSENDLFSKVMFVSFAYFFDTDGRWYYIQPGSFRIKVPLREVSEYLELAGKEMEFDLFRKIKAQILRTIADGWYLNDEEFHVLADRNGFDRERALRLYEKILYTGDMSQNDEDYRYWQFPSQYFEENQWLFCFLDRWGVVKAVGDGTAPGEMMMRKRREPRAETIDWGKTADSDET